MQGLHSRLINRTSRRVRSLVSVSLASRNPLLTLQAAKHHALSATVYFLHSGGRLTRGSAEYKGVRLQLPASQWYCLAALVRLMDWGVQVRQLDNRFSIQLPIGLQFECPHIGILWSALTMLDEQFLTNQYEGLRVKNAAVIDIGAFIGDSAVYFARRGALHVYAYEPYAELCATAKHNVWLNDCGERVSVFQQGVSDRSRIVTAYYNSMRAEMSGVTSDDSHPHDGCGDVTAESTRLISFADVLRVVEQRHPGSPVVCKVDCEGCEYNLLEAEGIEEVISTVQQLVIEYHGSDSIRRTGLAKRLRDMGFDVSVNPTRADLGVINASRKSLAARNGDTDR